MPRSVKHGGKKKKRYIKRPNLANARRRALKKKQNAISCAEIANEWKKGKTVKQNLEAMGLVYDINKALKLLPESNSGVEEMEVEDTAKIDSIAEQQQKKNKCKKEKDVPGSESSKVVANLEKAAAEATIRSKQGRKFRLIQKDIDFCVHLIRRYGDDYEAMSRDPANLYQNTPQQIQRKIRIFKKSPEYGTYFNAV